MRRGKYAKSAARKPVALVLALVLVVGAAIGGTIAWLTDSSDEVKNTFTVGNIDIDLTETKEDFKMIPGYTIEKDPIITVTQKSEDAWIFVQVNESENLDHFISYELDTNNWTKVPGTEDVYYIMYTTNNSADVNIKVLKDNMVTVNPDVTKEDMDAIANKTANQPTLSFTAYACQYMKDNDTPFEPAEAWAKVKPATP